ncbi:MAG: hypothetical protein KTR25_15290 [Myxococcales bacterium]|nr:hypothetical protein [Myxococcales bacterium]
MLEPLIVSLLVAVGLPNSEPTNQPSSWDISVGILSATPTSLPTGTLLGGSIDTRWILGTFWAVGLRADIASVAENDLVAVVQHLETRIWITSDVYTQIEIAEIGLRLSVGPSTVWETRTRHDAERLSIDPTRRTRVFASGQLEALARLPLINHLWVELAAGPQTTWLDNKLGTGISITGRVRWRQ